MGQRRSATEGYRRDSDKHLVEETAISELPHEITAAHEPGVQLARHLRHLLMNWANVSVRESDVRSRNGRQRPVREYPARRLTVVGMPLFGVVEQMLVVEHPLVGGRSHRHRTDLREEARERIIVTLPSIDIEEPGERVVLVRDVPVEARRREVLRLGHAATLPGRSHVTTRSSEPAFRNVPRGLLRTALAPGQAEPVWRPPSPEPLGRRKDLLRIGCLLLHARPVARREFRDRVAPFRP
jgi:hypothetical protein